MAVIDPPVTLEQVRASRGLEQPVAVAFPVSASDIRKFAMGVYWPETPPRMYWDEEYARQTPWGGIIAPQEFNPFAWPISGPSFFPHNKGLITGARRFYAGSEIEYGAPMRPGDVITATEHVADVVERRSKSGLLIFVVNEIIWRNQRDELVKKMLASLVHVVPLEMVP